MFLEEVAIKEKKTSNTSTTDNSERRHFERTNVVKSKTLTLAKGGIL